MQILVRLIIQSIWSSRWACTAICKSRSHKFCLWATRSIIWIWHYLPTFIQLIIFLSFIFLIYLRAFLLNIFVYQYNRCSTREMEREFLRAVLYKCVLGANGTNIYFVSSGSNLTIRVKIFGIIWHASSKLWFLTALLFPNFTSIIYTFDVWTMLSNYLAPWEIFILVRLHFACTLFR